MFEIPAGLLAWFYSLTDDYTFAIALIAVVVMAITTPLTLKSTKGMLEMQKLAPEMRKLQNEHRNDRQKLNEEMMKLYQEHKVNPAASCLPIVAQMPIFLIMFRILRGLVYRPSEANGSGPIAEATLRAISGSQEGPPGFIPRFLAVESDLYQSLYGKFEMPSFGLDLSKSAATAIGEGLGEGFIYALLVVGLGALYFAQQKMVAARATISPSMSPTQQKLMQYLPVFFAVFQIFFLSALVVYYIFQTLLRILQQYYITKKFYGGDESLGRQAQRAGEAAKEEAKKSGEPTGMLAQAKRDLGGAKGTDKGKNEKNAGKKAKDSAAKPSPVTNKRVTPSKSQPTSSGGGKGRPTRKEAEAARSSRPKSSNKKKR
ncbi:MAG: YidC/Oxa1 family membrane protein insertase [Ilumatobacter sp.]|nr:YidC/Oxa1 family membrane protein insertase [Ilumatobacter sp.]